MKKMVENRELYLMGIATLLAGAIPSLFVIAQGGYASLSDLGRFVLVPSVAALIAIYIYARRRLPSLASILLFGALSGFGATFGLELVREIGFHMGQMPGDMPKLLGVLLLDRFLEGPSPLSNLAGWGYHFTNGASFGIVLALVLGKIRWWGALIYAQLIAVGFMASPAVTALGIGRFGVDFGPGFAITVIVAHLAFGLILGILQERWLQVGGLLPILIRKWFYRFHDIEEDHLAKEVVLDIGDHWDRLYR
jgi:hypothetical protein